MQGKCQPLCGETCFNPSDTAKQVSLHCSRGKPKGSAASILGETPDPQSRDPRPTEQYPHNSGQITPRQEAEQGSGAEPRLGLGHSAHFAMPISHIPPPPQHDYGLIEDADVYLQEQLPVYSPEDPS